MKKLIIAALIATAVQSQAQQIINLGPGVAGNGITGTSPAYNIDMLTVDRFDGDKNPTVYVVINGQKWLVRPPSPYSSAYCRVINHATGAEYGYIIAKTPDGTQFLGGTIFANVKTWRVISFKGIVFYTPKTGMPFLSTGAAKVYVYKWSWITGTYVPRPDLTTYNPLVGGAIWVNDNTVVSGVLDFSGSGLGLNVVPVPPPGGIMKEMPLMPVWVR